MDSKEFDKIRAKLIELDYDLKFMTIREIIDLYNKVCKEEETK